jgi:Sugar phosphate permease
MQTLNVQNDECVTRPTHKRMNLLFILLITITIAYIDRVNITVLMADATFMADMGILNNPAKAGLLMTFFLIAYGIGNIFLSGLGDYYGPRKAMTVAIGSWFIAMMIGGFAPALVVMLIARFLLGLGEGLHFPMMNAFCRPWFPKKEKGTASAVWFMGTSVAPAIGMPVFAWIVSHYSWHYTFYTCAIVGVIPAFLVWFYTTDTPRQHKTINQAEIDYIEAGQDLGGEPDHKESMREMLANNFHLIASVKAFWVMVVYYCVHNMVYWGLLTWLPSYLKNERGFSWSEMGFLASMPFILAIVCKLVAGWASDKVGRRAPFCILAMGGTAICLYMSTSVANNYASAIFICLGMAVLTPGAPLSMTMLQEMLPKRTIGLGTGS